MYARMGAITDRSDSEMWMCNYTPLRFTSYCGVPSREDSNLDSSNYGKNLSEENRRRAEELARGYIQPDPNLNLLDYGVLGFDPIEEAKKTLSGEIPWGMLALAGVAAVVVAKAI